MLFLRFISLKYILFYLFLAVFTTACSSGGGSSDDGTGGETQNQKPVFEGAHLSVAEDTTLTGTLTATDPESDSISFAIVTGPNFGSFEIESSGSFIYIPNENFFGLDQVDVQVTDANGASASNIVRIDVISVNDNPVANAGIDQVVTENQSISLNGSGSDIDGTITGYSWSQVAGTAATITGGTTSQNLQITLPPVTGAPENLEFSFSVTDSDGGTATDSVVITVNPVNDPPTAVDDGYTTDEDTTLVISSANGVFVNDTDPDNNSLSANIQVQPSHGTLTFNSDGSFSYVPESQYFGSDTFTYQVSDGIVVGNTATVTIDIVSVNDAPVADAGPDAIAREKELVSLSGSATDIDGSVSEYLWEQVIVGAEPAVTISNSGMATASIMTPVVDQVTDFTFKLSATDNGTAVGVDEMIVTVEPMILQWSSLADRSSPADLSGSVQDGYTYIFAEPLAIVKRVDFYINDPAMAGSAYRFDTSVPFDLVGKDVSSNALQFNTASLPNGANNLTALITWIDNSTKVLSSNFTVDNNLVLPTAINFDDGLVTDWIVVADSGNATNWQNVAQAYGQFNDNVGNRFSGQSFDGSYHRGTYAYLAGKALGLVDYSFKVTAKLNSTAGNGLGVMFRYNDNDNYYRLTVSPAGSFARLEKKVAGVFSPLATNSRGYLAGDVLTIEVIVSGANIQAIINGDAVFGAHDTDLTAGTVALYSRGAASFDDVILDQVKTSVTIASPDAYTVVSGSNVTVTAVASAVPAGGHVEISLDGGITKTAILTSGVYSAQFTGVTTSGHTFKAELFNSSNVLLATDINEKVGVGGQYVVTLGDGIAYGSRDAWPADNTSANGRTVGIQGYQASISDLLTSALMESVYVPNEAVGGDTVSDTLTLRVNDLMDRHADVNKALVLSGILDAELNVASGQGIACPGAGCAGTFKGAMTGLVNAMAINNNGGAVTRYIATVMPALGPTSTGVPYVDPAAEPRNALISEYNTAIGEIVATMAGVEAGPDLYGFFLGGGVNRTSLYTTNYIPGSLGYEVLAHLWANSITGGASSAFFLDNLTISTGKAYKQDYRNIGDWYYIDRTGAANSEYIITGIPDALKNGVFLITANDDKLVDVAGHISFTIDRAADIYIAYDSRASVLPAWMAAFSVVTAPGGDMITVGNPGFDGFKLYKQAFASGSTVTLDGNMAAPAFGADANYLVVVVPQ